MISDPNDDGTYVVEFRTAEGEALAISIPRSETAVTRHFQERTVCAGDVRRQQRRASDHYRRPGTSWNQSSRSLLVFAGTCPGEVRLIEELLLLTCMGAFVAGIVYAGVILLD